MNIKLDEFHANLLRRLAELEREPSAVVALRALIRQAARDRGVWPTGTDADANLTENER